MAPIGPKNGAVWRAHFLCQILWTIWLYYDKRGANEKKENRPPKIETVGTVLHGGEWIIIWWGAVANTNFKLQNIGTEPV